MKAQKGFINFLITIILIIVILSILNINLRLFIEKGKIKENFMYIWEGIEYTWDNYLKKPAEYLWNNIFNDIKKN